MSDPAAAERYAAVRAASLALCEPLEVEDYVVQSMPDASPAKWHLAHATWFFERFVLQPHAPGHWVIDSAWEYLFNSYYDAVGPRHPRPERGLLTRPTVAAVLARRARVDEAMDRLLRAREPTDALFDRVELGLQHEQQHQELLLTDLKHAFSRNPLQPAYRAAAPYVLAAATATEFARFPGGLHDLGAGEAGFSFDNERPRHRVHLEPFEIATRLVSNAEYREFIRDGGYERPGLWLADGWAHRAAQGWTRPLYWSPALDTEFTLAGTEPLDPARPACHLSYYEADAFARWAGARLPTEAEWEVAATGASPGPQLRQLYGEAWQWTASPYTPYPGFRPAAGALGEYNGKFMVNQVVLRGSSCATPVGHARATYRNFFHPWQRWQFAGLRLARDA